MSGVGCVQAHTWLVMGKEGPDILKSASLYTLECGVTSPLPDTEKKKTNWSNFIRKRRQGMVVYTYTPCTGEPETGVLPWVQASLGYRVWPWITLPLSLTQIKAESQALTYEFSWLLLDCLPLKAYDISAMDNCLQVITHPFLHFLNIFPIFSWGTSYLSEI